MFQFDKFTIKQQLLIPSAAVIVGFLSIMLVYQYGQDLREQTDLKTQHVIDFYNTVVEVRTQALHAENNEKDFLLHNDTKYADQSSADMARLLKLVDKLEETAPSTSMLSDVQNSKKLLNNYHNSINQIVDSKIRLGLDETLGLLGGLRKSIHEVEGTLSKLGRVELANSMLMMRRHEKDFLARLNDKYVTKMIEEQKRFSSLLKQSSLLEAEKTSIRKQIEHYLQAFLSMVEGNKQVQKKISGPGNALSLLEPGLEALMDNSQAIFTDARKQLASEETRIGNLFSSALAIIGAIIVLLLVFISRRITGSLEQLIIRMRDLAEGSGDLSRRLTVSGEDETAMLAVLVNHMMENLSDLIGKVQVSGIQLASSVTEISASTKEQEATATEHAATTSQVAASIKEISSTSRQLGQTTEEVTHLAQGAAASAADGQVLLTNLDATMNRMSEASGGIADKLAALNEKASNIGDMVTTINKVADQTNLLSLNAAIEAEKAGEYGRGFAVVATEIRRLADQTAVATYDIEQMVSEVQSAVSAGVMSMDKFSEEIHSSVAEAKQAGVQLEAIIEQTQALAPHIESVNEGLQAQAEGAGQIDEAMVNLSEAAQQTAEFVRQSNSAITELNDSSRGLQEATAIFKVKS